MKLLFLSKDFCFNGGGERMLANLANRLSNDTEVTILSFDYSANKPLYNLNNNIRTVFANIRRRKINLFTKIDYIKYLNKFQEKNSFDCIIGVGIICNLILAFWSKKGNAKTIAWEHQSYDGVLIYQKILRRFLYKYLDKVVILTNYDLKRYQKINRSIEVIYNFSNMKFRKELEDNKTFLFVGRLSKLKGVDLLTEILSKYCSKENEWKFKIIGTGTEKEKLMQVAKNKGFIKRIEFMDYTNDIQTELEKSNCMLMTSRTEGLPMVLIESIICGVPAISFDTITGPAEIIKNGQTGFIIKRFDTDEFVLKMLEFSKNMDLQKSFSVEARYDSDRFIADRIIDNWKEVINV